ncbi:MAG: GAF domain-containing protein [Bacteroidetes bacterium]|nr:GAF domain-containing protein [Bacteroidota bacterium]
MVNAQVSNQANLMQYDYNMSKTQARIDALTIEKKNQRNLLIAAAGILLLILVAASLLLRNNRQKRKANALLNKQKQEIDAKAAELEKQKANLELLEEIGHNITSSLSVEKIIGTAYNNVNTLMDANVFGIGIYNEAFKRIDFPSTYEDGRPLPFYFNAIDDRNRLATVCFNDNKEIIMGDLDNEYKNYIQNIQTPHEGGQPLSVIFIPLSSKGKKLGVLTVQSFHKNAYTDYHFYMLRNIAIYTAIALENATSYQDLKATQAQLVQSEKMASLGELTAGIAHEIQNPLNFVNNFSDINNELLTEMKEELLNGNLAEAIAIADSLIENEKKINHHGKRADSIVKGMLEHSKASTGQKQPTDINTLCEEYLRLAYHGLRAKDKSFNADFTTDFDDSIGKINVVPQDMGRVLLNLFNNAFYTVNEKKKMSANGFKPVTKVVTRRSNDKIEIRVEDNGNGIAPAIIDKVFQPFFTTKPSGQGTGLGLSLSYDIIKAHNGDLQIETKEKEGTTFIILLSAN